jgi:thioredoxin 1
METTLNDENFKQEVLLSDKPVLVDFWAPWCGPCRMVSPAVSQIAEQMKNELKVGKLNVDENPKSAGEYQIFSIPCLKIFKNGKVIGEIIGASPKNIIEEKLKSILESN